MTELSDFVAKLDKDRDTDRTERRDDRKALHGRIDGLSTTIETQTTKIADMGATLTGVAVKVDAHEKEIDKLRDTAPGPATVRQAAASTASGMSWKQIGTIAGGLIAVAVSCSAAVVQSLASQANADEKASITLDAQLKSLAAQSRAMKAQGKSARVATSLNYDQAAEAEAEAEAQAAEAELAATVADLLEQREAIAAPEARPAIKRKAKAARTEADELGAQLAK